MRLGDFRYGNICLLVTRHLTNFLEQNTMFCLLDPNSCTYSGSIRTSMFQFLVMIRIGRTKVWSSNIPATRIKTIDWNVNSRKITLQSLTKFSFFYLRRRVHLKISPCAQILLNPPPPSETPECEPEFGQQFSLISSHSRSSYIIPSSIPLGLTYSIEYPAKL